MTELKLKRSPLLPSIPKEDEWEKFPRIEQWRRNHMTVMKQLHADAYDDIVAVDTLANSANALAKTANIHARMAHLDITFFPWEASNSNGTWALEFNANQLFNGFYRNTSANRFDYLTLGTVYFPAGNYVVTAVAVKGPDAGNMLVRIDANSWLTFNLYAANTTYNSILRGNVINNANAASRDVAIWAWYSHNSSSSNVIRVSKVNIRRVP